MATYKDLWEAVSRNNLQEVQKILSSGSNIDLNKPFGLHVQESSVNQHSVFRTQYPMDKTGNYLLQACLFSSPVVVSALVKAGANVNKSGVVMCKSNLNSKAAGIDVYEKKYNATPLILAVIQRNVELVKKLLHRCGADVNGRNDAGFSALHLTVKPARGFRLFGYEKINGSRTESSSQGEEIASLLLRAGATVDLQDKKGRTPLHIAVMENDVAAAKILIQYGARTDIPNHEGLTPLYSSSRKRLTEYDMCKLLIQKSNSSALNCAENDDGTPLLHAMIEKLIDIDNKRRRCDHESVTPNIPGSGQVIAPCTPVQCREEAVAVTVVKLLIESGADLKAKNNHFTPLHLAAQHGLINVIKLLVEAGADIHAETPNTGLTPLDMAEHGRKHDIVDYLKTAIESDTCRGEKNKREEPSVEQEDKVEPQKSDTSVKEEEESQKSDTPAEGIESLEEGAVGGFGQVFISEEGKPVEE
ncbi:ankyrin-2-like [Branchiostoma floridae]|uniref:Ankyrin-2-like n=1 Tax=Branchiostoma floridae TaxID=7739 RepID=A0A9J7K8C0_BRAFL|nr:ankyrin-2-like [Branchiostoma floridae]